MDRAGEQQEMEIKDTPPPLGNAFEAGGMVANLSHPLIALLGIGQIFFTGF